MNEILEKTNIDKAISSDGTKIAFYTANHGDETIIFLHGMFQSSVCWKYQFSGGKNFTGKRLVAIDMRGHGLSSKPNNGRLSYSNGSLWADDLESVIKKLNIKKFSVVAWSYGGYFLLDYIQKYGAERVSAINFVSIPFHLRRSYEDIGVALLDNVTSLMSDDISIQRKAMELFINAIFTNSEEKENMNKLLLNESYKINGRTAKFLMSRKIDFEKLLKTLNIPSLITVGDEDTVITPNMSFKLNKLLYGSKLSIFKNCAHAPFITYPDRFNEELINFLSSIEC